MVFNSENMPVNVPDQTSFWPSTSKKSDVLTVEMSEQQLGGLAAIEEGEDSLGPAPPVRKQPSKQVSKQVSKRSSSQSYSGAAPNKQDSVRSQQAPVEDENTSSAADAPEQQAQDEAEAQGDADPAPDALLLAPEPDAAGVEADTAAAAGGDEEYGADHEEEQDELEVGGELPAVEALPAEEGAAQEQADGEEGAAEQEVLEAPEADAPAEVAQQVCMPCKRKVGRW
jgi:hypothetical protein